MEDGQEPAEAAHGPGDASVGQPAALTPPTSEKLSDDQRKNATGDESELSELELDGPDEDIVPDHYWDGGKIPVFKPTMAQFRDFSKFIAKIDHYGMKSGIVKVIPPQEWRDAQPNLDEYVKRIKIKNPITQEFNGSLGTWTQQNVEKQRSYNLPEWKALTEESQHQPPARRGQRRGQQERSTRARGSPTAGDDDEPKKAKTRGKAKGGGRGARGQAKSVASRRLNNTAEEADEVDESAFEGFDYRMAGLDEFTPERCAELEGQYWKSLGFNQPMYAADMPGSLFSDDADCWNVARLPNLLDVLGTKVPGVNTAYLYMGMWKATFAWHLEDVDLYSINYIHFGAPKQWYSISQADARRFEAAMRSVWPVDSKNCDQFLRHKTYLISPDVLQKQHKVSVNKLVHYEGEFVITFPYGYHSGYNLGYNCAESVNFATDSWLEFGRIARKCNCEADNVWVDVSEIERKLRGEPTPEYYYDETDDDGSDHDTKLPSPPASVKGRSSQVRKRKRPVVDDKGPRPRRKVRIQLRLPAKMPCTLCPNDPSWEELLPTDAGGEAHRWCAKLTPETSIIQVDSVDKVFGISLIDKERLELKCNFCRVKRGACIQCSATKCTRAFHATCALAAGVLVDSGPVPVFDQDGTEYYEEGFDFRCKFHRPKLPKNVTSDSVEGNQRVLDYAQQLRPSDVVQAQYPGQDVFAGVVRLNQPGEQSVIVDVLPEGDRVEIEWKWLFVLDPLDSQRPKPSTRALPLPEGFNKAMVQLATCQDGLPAAGDLFHPDGALHHQEFCTVQHPPRGCTTWTWQPLPLHGLDLNSPETLYHYIPTVSTETRSFFSETAGSKTIAYRANFLERVAPRFPQPRPIAPTFGFQNIFNTGHTAPLMPRPPKPYVYKPREPPRPYTEMYESPAMTSQRFQSPAMMSYQQPPATLSDRLRAIAPAPMSQPAMSPAPISQQVNPPAPQRDAPSRSETPTWSTPQPRDSPQRENPQSPCRPFSREHYYSTETLPAAIPGQYSDFKRIASSTTPSNGTPVSAGNSRPSSSRGELPNGLAGLSNGVSNGLAGPSYGSSHGPTSKSSTSSFPSYGTPEEPRQDYLEQLGRYPYLRNCFLMSKRPYHSPYKSEGVLSPPWKGQQEGGDEGQGMERQGKERQSEERQGENGQTKIEKAGKASHTPSNSTSESEEWTPPSRVWVQLGLDRNGVKEGVGCR